MDINLANPRGFCAGVDRAIAIVNRALEVFGRPIYVRHEVVHNKFVVDDLRQRVAALDLDQRLAGDQARRTIAAAAPWVTLSQAAWTSHGVSIFPSGRLPWQKRRQWSLV